MNYLKAAISLKNLIGEANTTLLANRGVLEKTPNQMLIKPIDGDTDQIEMQTYSNEFVQTTLSDRDSEAFVITDIASMSVQGNEIHYILYKGYHQTLEKGLVLYQAIDKTTLEPTGSLLFSNMEENIFYNVDEPEVEESSCNAMETDKELENGKEIVFLIGHMDEDRLVYDIERLIVDTINNVSKNHQINFHFIIHIARYGGKPSDELKSRVGIIEQYTKQCIYPEYPNAKFTFAYEADGR